MTTLVIGANGQIGRQFCALAAEAELPLRAMVRHAEQAPYFTDLGVDVAVGDLEGDFRHAVEGCDEVIFTAGSGPRTGPDKTLMVDLHGAVASIDLADRLGLRRFVMVSALRAEYPGDAPEPLRPYMAAKHAADRILECARTPHLILKPGRLTDEPPSGRLTTNPLAAPDITISRGNVALALLTVVKNPRLENRSYRLLDGDRPVDTLFADG